MQWNTYTVYRITMSMQLYTSSSRSEYDQYSRGTAPQTFACVCEMPKCSDKPSMNWQVVKTCIMNGSNNTVNLPLEDQLAGKSQKEKVSYLMTYIGDKSSPTAYRQCCFFLEKKNWGKALKIRLKIKAFFFYRRCFSSSSVSLFFLHLSGKKVCDLPIKKWGWGHVHLMQYSAALIFNQDRCPGLLINNVCSQAWPVFDTVLWCTYYYCKKRTSLIVRWTCELTFFRQMPWTDDNEFQ